jgi:hypothetical protein
MCSAAAKSPLGDGGEHRRLARRYAVERGTAQFSIQARHGPSKSGSGFSGCLFH